MSSYVSLQVNDDIGNNISQLEYKVNINTVEPVLEWGLKNMTVLGRWMSPRKAA